MGFKKLAVLALLFVLVAAVGYGAYGAGKNAGRAEALVERDSVNSNSGRSALAAPPDVEAGRRNPLAANAGDRLGNLRSFAGGQVKAINGNTIELSMGSEAINVIINDQTQVQKTVVGSPADIQPGDRIVIQGERAADGSFTARTIQIGQAALGNSAPHGGP